MTSLLERTNRKEINSLRAELKDALKSNNSDAIDDVQYRMLAIGVPLKSKCQQITIHPIVTNNCKGPNDWDAVSVGLGIMEKYTANLLRKEEDRPKGWECITTTNEVFSKRVKPIIGTRHILRDIGYSDEEEGVIRIGVVPNEDRLMSIRADLKIAKCELDLYRTKAHPFPQQIDGMVGELARIKQDPEKQKPFKSHIQKITATKNNQPEPTNQQSSSAKTPPTGSGPFLSASQSREDPQAATIKKIIKPKAPPPPVAPKSNRIPPQFPPYQMPGPNSFPGMNTSQANLIVQQPSAWNQPLPRYIARAPTHVQGHNLQYAPPGPPVAYADSTRSPGYHPYGYPNEPPPPYSMCRPPHLNSPYGPYQMNAPRMAWPDVGTGDTERRENVPQDALTSQAEALPEKVIYDPSASMLPVYPSAPLMDTNVRSELSEIDMNIARLYPALPPSSSSDARTGAGQQQGIVRGGAQRVVTSEPQRGGTQRKKGGDGKRSGSSAGKKSSGESSKQGGGVWQWFKRHILRMGSTNEDTTALDSGEEMVEKVWSGTDIRVPRGYYDLLLKEPNENKRFQKLENFIDILERETKNYEDKMDKIIMENEDFQSDSDYKIYDREKGHIKRELILLKRVREDVRAQRPDIETADVAEQSETSVTETRQPRWACVHCTFINPMNENICGVCAKTADKKIPVEEEEEEFVTPPEQPTPPREPIQLVWSANASAMARPLQPPQPVVTDRADDDVGLIMDWMKEVEDKGFTVHQFEFALKACHGCSVTPLNWLTINWPIMVEYVKSELAKNRRALGEFSEDAVEEVLMRSDSADEAVIKCKKQRKDMLDRLRECYSTVPRNALLKMIGDHQGDEVEICRQLNDQVLEPILDEIPQIINDKNLLDNGMAGDTEFFQIIKNGELNEELRLLTLMTEGRLTERQAEDIIYIVVNELLEKDNVKDLMLAELIEAVHNNYSIDSALAYLHRECPLCFAVLPETRMRSLFLCQCKFCHECLIQYFDETIRNRQANSFNCPQCELPNLNGDSEERTLHFTLLDVMLKHYLTQEVYGMFQQKLLEWRLMENPRFRWCQKDECGMGFIFDPERVNQLRVQCPHCFSSTCYECNKPWAQQHEGITCAEFADWQEKNNPATAKMGIEKLLEENGIMCPKCKNRYELARGGCLHFTCTYCKFEFCSGCNEEITRECKVFPDCRGRGIHAHHPRYCLHFLRDVEPAVLTELLENNGVQPRQVEQAAENRRDCRVMEQKESPNGLIDEACGKPTANSQNGLCLNHYREYLVNLLNRNRIDPVVIMQKGQLEGHLRENRVNIPDYSGLTEAEQQQRLQQIVRDSIPLQYK